MSLAALQVDCKKAVSSLSHLSNDELDEIVNSDDKIESILNDLEQSYLRGIQDDKDAILASNNSMAEFNISREPSLIEAREKLEETSKEGEELSSRVEEKVKELKQKTGDMSLETALALLQTSASEIEEETDTIAKKFLDNDMELDEFLEQFLDRRKIVHTRLVKAEKMAKILSRNPSLNNIPSYINAPPVNINSAYFPGVPTNPTQPSVPYPVGPFNMPMPNYFQNHY